MYQIAPSEPTQKQIVTARQREVGTSARSKYYICVKIVSVVLKTRKHEYGTEYENTGIFAWFYPP